MSTIEDLHKKKERIERELEEVREAIRKVEGPKLGKLPNKRGGFHHIHSNSYECGMAYWTEDEYTKGHWHPCKRLVNHKGPCGYEDNSAF